MAATRLASGASALAGRWPQCWQQVSAVTWARMRARTAVKGMRPGSSAGQGGGAGGGGGGDVVDEQQRPGFLAGEFGGLAAQRAAGAADGFLQVEERDFDLPSFGIEGGDLAGRVGLVVQEGGQDPDQGGLRPAAAGAGGDGEGDEPGGGVREPFGVRVAGLAAPPGPHAVGFAQHDQLRPVGQGPDGLERDGFRAVLDPPGQVRAGGRRTAGTGPWRRSRGRRG